MNAFLSFLVCFAMLFSGGAALPAQPETATVWTLRKLSVATADGSVTLAPEARLTAAIGSDAATLQFELVNGDETLLPIAGELTQDGLRFRLSEDGSVYSLSNDALPELLDEEEMQLMARLVEYLDSYGALLQRSMNDVSFQQEFSRTMIELLVSACGSEAEPVNVEIDGAEVPARYAQLELTPEAALDLLDGLASCGVTEVEDMLNSFLLLLATATNEDYTDLSDFTAEQRELLDGEDAISLPMELTWTTEGPAHVEIAMDFDAEETTAVQLAVTSTSTDEKTEVDMGLRFVADDGQGYVNTMDFSMTGQVDGALNAPENVELHIEAGSQIDWENEYSEDGSGEDETYIYTSGSAMNYALDVHSTVVDGLEHAVIDVSGSQSSHFNYDEHVDIYGTTLSAHITADDRSEADGSVTTDIAAAIDFNDTPIDLTCELNRAEGMPLPTLDGSDAIDLAELVAGDESGAVSAALTSDLLSLSADASGLGADESVLALLELLGADPDAMADDDWDDDTVYEEYDYDDSSDTVYSMDEAAAIYEGALPAFTVPGDLVLDYIDVSDSYLDASYSSDDGERSMDLSFYDYGESQGDFYVLEDGALKEAGAIVILEALDEEGSMFSADVGTTTGTCSFYFYGFAQEEVMAVLASLQF